MDVLFFFLAVAAIFVLVSAVAMWGRTSQLQEDLEVLQRQVQYIRDHLPPVAPLPVKHAPQPTPAAKPLPDNLPADPLLGQPSPAPLPSAHIPPAAPVPPASTVPVSHAEPALHGDEAWSDEAPSRRGSSAPPPPPTDVAQQAEDRSFEFNFGKKLPVWIGGVALALSGFYLVKYSIDKGLLTEEVRVLLGVLFGAALILAARHIRIHKPDMADGVRITQALSGAGVSSLYATVVAATSLYHMWPAPTGFVAMAMVTALAVGLAVRHGMPIAVLGMLGGFLTPALIHSNHPHLGELLLYLYVLVLGLFAVISMLAWWVLALPTVILAFLWVIIWVFAGHFEPGDGVFLGLFILAVAGTCIGFSAKKLTQDDESAPEKGEAVPSSYTEAAMHADWPEALNYAIAFGAVALMGFVTAVCRFATEDWMLYGVLGAGTLAMAWYRPRQYRFAPWLSMAGTLIMLCAWEHAANMTYLLILSAFALLYGLGGLVLLTVRPALDAAGLVSAAALGFYAIAWARIEEHIGALLQLEPANGSQHVHVWGPLALMLACLFGVLVKATMNVFAQEGEEERQQVLALFALTTTAFLSIGLGIEVRHDFLGVAFAAETLAVCWINTKVDIKALRKIAGILLGIFTLLMGEQLLVLGAVVFSSLFGVSPSLTGLHLATDPMFQLGLPMVLLAAADWYTLRQRDGRLAEYLEIGVVALGALLLYYGTRNLLHVPADVIYHKPGFSERGLITNLFYGAGLAVAYGGRLYSRRAVVWSGTAIFGMALFRTGWFDFIVGNPLLNSDQEVGSAFLFNGLLLAYLMPVFWLWLEEKPALRLATTAPSLRGGIAFLLLFVYVSFNVRQGFHGTHLEGGTTSVEEKYAYSAVWLMLGALLLFLGTLRKDKTLRKGSLVVMLLTIGKVFLYDATNLEGLYRVFSFLGLGVSLLALSWFYSRFVFVKDKE
jgi:uncharacterized membrane protein